MLLERNDAPCFLTTKPDEGGKRLPVTAAVIEVVTDACGIFLAPLGGSEWSDDKADPVSNRTTLAPRSLKFSA
jgi:hypothetical protein